MLILFQVITGILFIQLGFALWNAALLPRVGEVDRSDSRNRHPGCLLAEAVTEAEGQPLVSVCIPARNEAGNIEACLRSVQANVPERFAVEVLVLDDHSEDGTAGLVRLMSAADQRIRLLSGTELPHGWMGKSYACHQLAQAAQGRWLLFLDADVRLGRDAIESAMATALQQGTGLVTGFPYQQTGTWMERLVVPMMMFTIICHLPVLLVQRSGDPRFVAAHGAFMLIDRDTYDLCGGHEAIRSGLVDDMALARRVKAAGKPVTLADVRLHLKMRMYSSGRDVWHGYRKNIYEGVGRSGFILGGMLILYFFLYLLPLLSVGMIWVIGYNESAWWAFAAILAGMAVKWTADRAGGQPPWLFLLLPVSIFCLSAIALSSWRAGRTGRGYIWKGRRYE